MNLVARALVLVLVGGGVGVAANGIRPGGLSLRRFEPPTSCAVTAGAASIEVLPPDRAVRLCGDPDVLVADARTPARFAEGHVTDAVHLPCAASQLEASTLIDRLGPKHTLIVYGDTTEEARPVAEDLRGRIGRKDVRVIVLEGGFPAWNRAGLACSSGACQECGDKKQ